ncbi:hypothetical protein CHARACLAT_023664 [Characodon lateralis]|uniref:Uncharacterized protein n=1 Tax=Characodon lateralis TaxID=208331 RepID=A0ABU7F6R2_9TELE|nr:hypothetical protein [Characodon lateralis]
MWRSSSSTPSPSQMAKLITLSLRECLATLRRKLILATCIHNGPAQHPYYRSDCTALSVDLRLHSPLTREQDPEIPELLHLRQELLSSLKRASHPFPFENHGLGLGGDDPHISCFTLSCNRSNACCRS